MAITEITKFITDDCKEHATLQDAKAWDARLALVAAMVETYGNRSDIRCMIEDIVSGIGDLPALRQLTLDYIEALKARGV